MLGLEQAFVEHIVRSVHIAVLASSFLLVVTADFTASKSTLRNLGPDDFKRLHRNHNALTWALLLFWLTGAFLIWAGTQFDVSQFTPKLIAKLIVVSILTVNAWVIGRVLLPFMEANSNATFGDFPFADRLRLTLCGAASSASWLSAFCLGALQHLRTATPQELIDFICPIYAGLGLLGVLFAIASGNRKPKATPEPVASEQPVAPAETAAAA
jgi:hypothetical protein